MDPAFLFLRPRCVRRCWRHRAPPNPRYHLGPVHMELSPSSGDSSRRRRLPCAPQRRRSNPRTHSDAAPTSAPIKTAIRSGLALKTGHVSNYDEVEGPAVHVARSAGVRRRPPGRQRAFLVERRRPELIRVYETEIYGRVPGDGAGGAMGGHGDRHARSRRQRHHEAGRRHRRQGAMLRRGST